VVPAAGVPLSVAVPFPLFTNVTPPGSAPVAVSDGVGIPVEVTVKVQAVPTVNVALLLAIMLRGCGCAVMNGGPSTVKVATALVAVIVSG
jgi:hypothetical protein